MANNAFNGSLSSAGSPSRFEGVTILSAGLIAALIHYFRSGLKCPHRADSNSTHHHASRPVPARCRQSSRQTRWRKPTSPFCSPTGFQPGGAAARRGSTGAVLDSFHTPGSFAVFGRSPDQSLRSRPMATILTEMGHFNLDRHVRFPVSDLDHQVDQADTAWACSDVG
jgi:hypothetical protein